MAKNKSFADIAYGILKDKARPLASHELTQEVLRLKETRGKTPQATLVSALTRDGRFRRVGPGKYGLAEWSLKSGISTEVEVDESHEIGHSTIIDTLVELGQALGFESFANARLSLFSGDVPTVAKLRTMDVLWRDGNSAIPIEVQVHGSRDALLRRLEMVEPYSRRMVVVADSEQLRKIRSEIEDSKPPAFARKVVYIEQDLIPLIKGHTFILKWVRNLFGL